MLIFRIQHQHKWHFVDPADHNHSLCRENYNANPKVVEATEFDGSQKMCNICVSRGYKRGYLGLRPLVKFDRKTVHRFESIDDKPIKRLYTPEKNWHEVLDPNRTNEITDQPGSLTNRFIGFLMECLKGKHTGQWTLQELDQELMSKTKHTKKEKRYWNDNFLKPNSVLTTFYLFERYYSRTENGKKLFNSGRIVNIRTSTDGSLIGYAIQSLLLVHWEEMAKTGKHGETNEDWLKSSKP